MIIMTITITTIITIIMAITIIMITTIITIIMTTHNLSAQTKYCTTSGTIEDHHFVYAIL